MRNMPTLLDERIDRLAALRPSELPVVSLYLNTQSDQHGKDQYTRFLRKELRGRGRTFPPRSPARDSFERDTERIQAYLRDELRPSANGVALFACAGEDLFEALQLDAPVERHEMHIGSQPHLYTLARINDQYPRYAALVADTNAARLFVFGLSRTLGKETVQSPKLTRHQMGGWSQARYQRHVDNYHLHHAKEVIDQLLRVVLDERIEHVILAGDEVVIPLIRQQLPPQLEEKVVDVLRLDITAPEHKVLEETLAVMRRWDSQSDREKVEQMIGEYRAGGLGLVGAREVLGALLIGQVDELFLTASPDRIAWEREENEPPAPEIDAALKAAGGETIHERVADALVSAARKSGAQITFVEDPALLADVGGVGATLRYRLETTG